LKANYIVRTQGFSGIKVTRCETVREAWYAVGDCSFGALYEVWSETGKDCTEFIPF
jgi:hypothetical protein